MNQPQASVSHPSHDEFAALLEETLSGTAFQEGSVVKGTIVAIEKDVAVIDVGLKTEGRIPLKEFGISGRAANLSVGDEVDVYLERVENAMGEAVLSREKARREESWTRLEEKYKAGERVEGVIFNRVKGGFTVDLDGAVAFLPGSQVDIRPIRDVSPLMNVPQPFQILKMDRRRGNIVVSRRSVLEETRAEKRSEIVARLEEGQVIEGVVKNITDYGAFVELEPGVEGLIHVSEMSWTKKNIHPGKIISTSQEVEVQVLEVDPEKRRISLGLKQTQENPWVAFAANHPPGTNIEGPIRNITEFGLFIGLDGGIDGMVHLSDLDWSKSGEDALKDYNKGDNVKAVVLEADSEKERISLGVKQLTPDPFASGAPSAKLKKGMRVTCEVVAVKDSGLEVKLVDHDLTSFIRRSDLSRDRSEQRPDRFGVGEKFDAVVTQVDAKARKVGVSIKALEVTLRQQLIEGSQDGNARNVERSGERAGRRNALACGEAALHDRLAVRVVDLLIQGLGGRSLDGDGRQTAPGDAHDKHRKWSYQPFTSGYCQQPLVLRCCPSGPSGSDA